MRPKGSNDWMLLEPLSVWAHNTRMLFSLITCEVLRIWVPWSGWAGKEVAGLHIDGGGRCSAPLWTVPARMASDNAQLAVL